MVKESATDQRRRELREALIAVAMRKVSEEGYQALRARDLAAEVGCASGAIYNVFADLDALMLTVKSRTLDQLQAFISDKLGPDDSQTLEEGEARLMDLASVYLEFARRNRRLWFSAFDHSSPDTPVLQAYMLRLNTILANIERPLVVIFPNMTSRRRRLLARALFSAVHGVVSLGLDQKLGAVSDKELQWQVRTVLGAALKGIQTGEIA